jgi:O-antigen/teichoic acid export membrane protein
MGIKGYYVAYNLSFILMMAVCFRYYRPGSVISIFTFKNLSRFSIHWNYAKTSMIAYLLSEISAYVDILLISFLIRDMKQIGYYSFALTITVLLRIIPSTIQQITIPYFSALAQQKNEFLIAFKRYNKLLYIIIAITLLVALIFIPFFLHWIFAGKYDPSMKYFLLLAIGWSFRMLAQLQYGALFGLGKLNYNVYSTLVSLIFNIIIISISLYFFGLIGAAYASVLGGLVYIFCSRYFFSKAKNEM